MREVENRTKKRFNIGVPTGRELDGETMRSESQAMHRGDGLTGPANDIVCCYHKGIDDYPREHGSYQHFARELLGKHPPGPPVRPASVSRIPTSATVASPK